MTEPIQDQVFRLANALSAGGLAPNDAAALQRLLAESAEARQAWYEHQDLEIGLAEHFTIESARIGFPYAYQPAPASQTSHFFNGLWGWAAGAALFAICLTMLGTAAWISQGSNAIACKELATLLLAEDCVWERQQLREGQRLMPSKLELSKGMAIVRFDGGAELILQAKSKVELASAGEARLIKGKVTARVPEAAAGFRILTQGYDIVDLGTEFTLEVGEDDATELQVLEGAVEWKNLPDKDPRKRLEAGNALVFQDTGREPKSVPVSDQRFGELVKQIRPQSQQELLFAEDNFAYPTGRHELPHLNGGQGWKGPWRMRHPSEFRPPENTERDLNIVQRDPEIPWVDDFDDQSMLELTVGSTILVRDMKSPLKMDEDRTYYISMLVCEPKPNPRQGLGPLDEGVRLTFRSSNDFMGPHVSFGISQYQFPCIRTKMGVGVVAYSPVPVDQPTLWIGKIVCRAEDEDEIFLSIFSGKDRLGLTEPRTWQVSTRGVYQDGQLDIALISSQSNQSKATRLVDRLRIGPTWRSVVPLNSVQPEELSFGVGVNSL